MGAKSLVQPVTKLYDEDFVVWASETARLLREGRFEEIDVENLVEEVEAMAGRDQREVSNRLRVILQHLLKWQFQARKRSGSWHATIITQRAELEGLLEQSPSLRRSVPAAIAQVYAGAVKAAGAESGLAPGVFPRKCPYSPEQILDEEFLPER